MYLATTRTRTSKRAQPIPEQRAGTLSSAAALLAIAVGCTASQPRANIDTDIARDVPVEFEQTLTALARQTTQSARTSDSVTKAGDEPVILVGSLQSTHLDSDTTQEFAWSVSIDPRSLDVVSNKTIVLAPGTHDFALSVTRGSQTYAGSARGVPIVASGDGENTVALTIRPVIGDVITDVSAVAELADFRLQLDPAELAEADVAAPRLGVIVDGGTQRLFAVNPATGLSQHMHLDLAPGPHTMALRLYDGAVQVGKSVPAQEAIVAAPGDDLAIDIIPLHGEVELHLAEAGGSATFTFHVPAEVVDEAGSASNLETLLSVVGPGNPLREAVVALTPDDDSHRGTVTFVDDLQFGTITMTMAFRDIRDDDPLGRCVVSDVRLATASSRHVCALTLRRRAVIGSSLLGVLGVNVFTEALAPVAGAVVEVDGQVVGVTGSGGFGTPGYLRVFLPRGDHAITARSERLRGGESIITTALAVHNQDIVLDEDPPIGEGIALFSDTRFVDHIPGNIAAEASNLEAALRERDHDVTPFTGISAAELSGALDGRAVVIFPEQERGDLGLAMTGDARGEIVDFVSAGGTAIFCLTNRRPIRLMNRLFGFDPPLADVSASSTSLQTAAAADTRFADGPASLPGLNATRSLTVAAGSLPFSGQAIYADDRGGATVARIPFGAGELVILGFDWFNARPVGTQDDGWNDTLDLATGL